MSYQVLARKWRPKRFVEMVGQEHVLKALVNALDADRLHHAYLFTGTRGVGKTSIARLFAKSLNCEQGVGSEPCGVCSACTEIAEGRFVDLIEVDAASRTKVEDTRELLENVQYAPTQGRYKVYLIDEVHMLSGHSFNALLKTLEEPPPHIKFLLATTDPQKLPVTILSRCLQFNLKNLPAERIVEHLRFVLDEEAIKHEEGALWLLARSAAGSMRDALSLTDQAIAFGSGSIGEQDVREMLGTIDHNLVFELLDALIAGDGKALLDSIQAMSEFSPDYESVLGELISILHRVALAQVVPNAIDNSLGDQERVLGLAKRLSAEETQLFYQIALNGRKDLPLVPQPREGLEMTLLRMLAFKPLDAPRLPDSDRQSAQAAPSTEVAQPEPSDVEQTLSEPPPWDQAPPQVIKDEGSDAKKSQPGSTNPSPVTSRQAEATLGREATDVRADSVLPSEPPLDPPLKSPSEPPTDSALKSESEAPAVLVSDCEQTTEVTAEPESAHSLTFERLTPEHWISLVEQLDLSGMTESLARNLSLERIEAGTLLFHYTQEQEALLNPTHRNRITDALTRFFAQPIDTGFEQSAQTRETPAAFVRRRDEERKTQAIADLKQDPVVIKLIETFGVEIDESSVEPLGYE